MYKKKWEIEAVCRSCGKENKLGCEIYDEPACEACGSTLQHEIIAHYIDQCPLCNAAYEFGKPYVFRKDQYGTWHWLCRICESSPRGIFFSEFEQCKEIPEDAPLCCLCGDASKLLVLTRGYDNGQFICEPCSLTNEGIRMVGEHYEDDESRHEECEEDDDYFI